MNIKNLIMWVIIVLLSVGLFNMFQDPSKNNTQNNSLAFSEFFIVVEDGRVGEVKIQGKILPDYCLMEINSNLFPNYPELVDKLSSKV